MYDINHGLAEASPPTQTCVICGQNTCGGDVVWTSDGPICADHALSDQAGRHSYVLSRFRALRAREGAIDELPGLSLQDWLRQETSDPLTLGTRGRGSAASVFTIRTADANHRFWLARPLEPISTHWVGNSASLPGPNQPSNLGCSMDAQEMGR